MHQLWHQENAFEKDETLIRQYCRNQLVKASTHVFILEIASRTPRPLLPQGEVSNDIFFVSHILHAPGQIDDTCVPNKYLPHIFKL